MKMLLAVLLLAGCAALPGKFDSNEQMYYANLEVLSQDMCNTDSNALESMRLEAKILVAYTRYSSEGSRKLAEDAKAMLDGIPDKMSPTFCAEASKNLYAGYDRILKTLSGRAQ